MSTFADRWCHVVSVTDPYGRILGFLDRSRYFSFKYPQLHSEAEWTPFQTHYFSENLVVPGIEAGPLDLYQIHNPMILSVIHYSQKKQTA
jgi:hypothetical protein